MTEPNHQLSNLVEIARRNGDFRRNYGTIIGAFLYLRSLSAARRRPWFWTGWLLAALSAALPWLWRHHWPWPGWECWRTARPALVSTLVGFN